MTNQKPDRPDGDGLRFYIDHGVIHDRVTGKHVVTDGEWPHEDDLPRVLAFLNSLAPVGERLMPLSDINDLDDVCRELGIQDSHTTPAQAVKELNEEIERLRATTPTRDGAEGAGTLPPVCCYCDADLSCAKCGMEQPADYLAPPKPSPDAEPLDVLNSLRQWQHDPAVDWRTRKLAGDAADVIGKLRTRKPPPDAMREALVTEITNHVAWTMHPEDTVDLFDRIIKALSTPVPSPDGAFPRFLGSSSENGSPRVARCVFAVDLSGEDHRKIATALIYARSPSPAVEAEPVADGPCFYCGKQTNGYAGDPGLWPLQFCQPDGTGITRFHHTRCVTSWLTSPPVRGDLEAIAREIRRVVGRDLNPAQCSNLADAILSLPVKPGADS